jgi:hypothetical protein
MEVVSKAGADLLRRVRTVGERRGEDEVPGREKPVVDDEERVRAR